MFSIFQKDKLTITTQPILVHIFGQSPHHYIPMKSFFEKVNQSSHFAQVFWAWRHPHQTEALGFEYYADSHELIMRMKALKESARFIFHGFFDPSVWPKLFFSKLPKHCSWVSWGHDIYRHKADDRSIKDKGMHIFHALVIRRFMQNYSLNKGDAEIIRSLLWKDAVKVLPYPLIGSNVTVSAKKDTDPYIILVGNSASPNNEHIEALEWLRGFANENVRVVIPLNYAGPTEYVKKVIEYGKTIFKDRFEGITGMLDKNEYDRLLASADVVVFAHHRQQGLYVAYSMLKFGRKIFFRERTTSYTTMIASGFKVNISESIPNLTFEQFIDTTDVAYQRNPELMHKTFSEDALLPLWREELKNIINEH